MPELEFRVRGQNEASGAFDKIAESQDKAKQGADELTQGIKLTGAELAKLDRLQQEIARRNETAEDRFARKLRDTKLALAGNKDEARLLAAETKRLFEEYQKAGDKGGKAGKELQTQLNQAHNRSQALRAELAKLPPLLNDAEKESKEFSGGLDLGAKSAKKTKEEILGIKTQSASTFGDKGVQAIAAWAAGFMSVAKAAALVTEEMRLQQELVDKRTAAQLTVGEGRNILLRTLVGSSDAEIDQALAASQKIAADTGVSEARIAPALADAISAIGGDVGKATSATRVAARYMAGSPEEITEFAGSLLDISKSTGTADAQTNLGLYQLLGKLSRVNDPSMMQQTIPNALQGMGSFGASYQDSGALFAALSNAGGDKQGRSTRTASVALVEQLQRYTRDELGLGELPLSQQIGLMQMSPMAGKAFFKKIRAGGFGASFEKKTLGAVRDLLLDPKSGAAEEFRAALGQIPNLEGLNAIGGDAIEMLDRKNPLNVVQRRTRAIGSGLEQIQTDMHATGSLSMDEREKLKSILMESGFSGLGAKFQNFVQGLGDGGRGLTVGSAVEMLKNAERANQGTWFGPEAPHMPQMPADVAARDRVLERLIDLLEQTEKDRNAVLEEIERNTRGGGANGALTGTDE